MGFGMAGDIIGIRSGPLKQPQHAAFRLVQNAHPARENLRRQLVALVEVAEDKAGFGQSGFSFGRRKTAVC